MGKAKRWFPPPWPLDQAIPAVLAALLILALVSLRDREPAQTEFLAIGSGTVVGWLRSPPIAIVSVKPPVKGEESQIGWLDQYGGFLVESASGSGLRLLSEVLSVNTALSVLALSSADSTEADRELGQHGFAENLRPFEMYLGSDRFVLLLDNRAVRLAHEMEILIGPDGTTQPAGTPVPHDSSAPMRMDLANLRAFLDRVQGECPEGVRATTSPSGTLGWYQRFLPDWDGFAMVAEERRPTHSSDDPRSPAALLTSEKLAGKPTPNSPWTAVALVTADRRPLARSLFAYGILEGSPSGLWQMDSSVAQFLKDVLNVAIEKDDSADAERIRSEMKRYGLNQRGNGFGRWHDVVTGPPLPMFR